MKWALNEIYDFYLWLFHYDKWWKRGRKYIDEG